jgi:ABC-type ATPase with predicted acetyltransferase domain
MPATPKRCRRTIKFASVGEDITAPRQVASGGRLRVRSERAATVARWFGLRKASAEQDAPATDPMARPELMLTPGTITLITGPSGAGKSSLLRATRERVTRESTRHWIYLAELDPPDVPVVDCFGDDLPLRDVLLLLSRVGLGEAWSYLRNPEELSEGQRWRLKLALGLHAASRCGAGEAPVLACDEFAAVLDRVTASIVPRCLRRAIDAMPHAAAVLATSHDDLQPALRPEMLVWCDFGVIESVELAKRSASRMRHG